METKLEPFDLEAAKAGAKVVTRDGRDARILCFDAMGSYPIVAIVRSDYEEIEVIGNIHDNPELLKGGEK